ncbi:MAG: hypothetical protein OXF75_08975 [Acidimicrobiaceae bacterium]|nr:hypothetical protein [Acidimicrobiaceae bacterium]
MSSLGLPVGQRFEFACLVLGDIEGGDGLADDGPPPSGSLGVVEAWRQTRRTGATATVQARSTVPSSNDVAARSSACDGVQKSGEWSQRATIGMPHEVATCVPVSARPVVSPMSSYHSGHLHRPIAASSNRSSWPTSRKQRWSSPADGVRHVQPLLQVLVAAGLDAGVHESLIQPEGIVRACGLK